MRAKGVLLFALLGMATAGVFAQSGGTTEKTSAGATSLEGVWRAEMDGLPAITLTLTNEGGRLTGAVLFYLHRREAGQPVTATPGVPKPLFKPTFDGRTLTFQVSHRRAHPPQTLADGPITFDLKMTGADRGELVDENEREPGAPLFVLVRSAY
jgi:hypothetical protein